MKPKTEVRNMRKGPFIWQDRNFVRYMKILTPVATTLYIVLTSYANHDQQCWPSQGQLAELLNVNLRTVKRALDSLESHGLIRSERGGVGRYSKTVYTLVQIPVPEVCTPTVNGGLDATIPGGQWGSGSPSMGVLESIQWGSGSPTNNNKEQESLTTTVKANVKLNEKDRGTEEGAEATPLLPEIEQFCNDREFRKDNHSLTNEKQSLWPPVSHATPAEVEKPFLTLPTNGRLPYHILSAYLRSWKVAYPHLDVEQELKKMAVWLEANPDRRKTLRGTPRFVVNWLARSHNGNGNHGQQSNTKPCGGMKSVDEFLREQAERSRLRDSGRL